MKLAFYYGNGDLITDLIRVITWGRYSHVELVFSNGQWFSSSGRGNAGVRWKDEPGKEGWDFLELPLVTAEAEEQAIALAEDHIGLPFNWAGLWSFILPWVRKENEDYWFCSEIILHALQNGAGLLSEVDQDKTSPNRLFEIVSNQKVPTPMKSAIRLAAIVGFVGLVGFEATRLPRWLRRFKGVSQPLSGKDASTSPRVGPLSSQGSQQE